MQVGDFIQVFDPEYRGEQGQILEFIEDDAIFRTAVVQLKGGDIIEISEEYLRIVGI